MTVAVILALLPLLFGIKNKKATYYLQGMLVLGAIQWCMIAYDMLAIRIAMQEDWIRMVSILVAVALFSLFSAYQLSEKKSLNKT